MIDCVDGVTEMRRGKRRVLSEMRKESEMRKKRDMREDLKEDGEERWINDEDEREGI